MWSWSRCPDFGCMRWRRRGIYGQEGEESMGHELVSSLAASDPDSKRLGGKGANLARLLNLGYRVPPGFVVTTDAFAVTLEQLGVRQDYDILSESMARTDPDHDAADSIAQALRQGGLPTSVRIAIGNALDEERLWHVTRDSLIVRSSATVEDSAAFSFAGIFDSLAVGDPDALESTVLEVWCSLYSRRALAYTADSGVAQRPRMAVVVQAFLDASHSGVMFTSFGDGRTLVEHVEGGCEKLVKGEVIPHRLRLGSTPGDVEGAAADLAPKHIASLQMLARDLEDDFGEPQDVEWCVYEDDLYLLQTRPITARFDEAPTRDTTGALLVGVGASGGVGSGDVHLVFNIDQALALETGQVLVTPMTNPDMVVAMRNSAAIVTDVGGMICHAAIVSRELGLPCVVGTQEATTTLGQGQIVTVDGASGTIYDDIVDLASPTAQGRPGTWINVWDAWTALEHPEPPVVPCVEALASAPSSVAVVVLRPDIDLRADSQGLWADLERMTPGARSATLRTYVDRIAQAADVAGVETVNVVTDRLTRVVADALSNAAARSAVYVVDSVRSAVPLSTGLVTTPGSTDPRLGLPSIVAARSAAKDTLKFFGHQPGVVRTTMPDPVVRSCWWERIPEYGRFHREADTPSAFGDFDWLEVRPELVISPLLKSLVQPGFEMIPRIMGFRDTAPLHIKWIRCRYHFRSDVFDEVWQSIVDATWDADYMADLMHRVRDSYDQLAEVLLLFPEDEAEIRVLSGGEIVSLITSWWPRWIEFFALCWFLQAQGDDILYPFIEETVAANLEVIGQTAGDVEWPVATDLLLPTTPVLSARYMASVGTLSEAMLARGLADTDAVLAVLDSGEDQELADIVQRHLDDWHWMRDRDLQFEPWDTPARVIETALRTEPHAIADYAENLRRDLMALALHSDLADVAGRSSALNHAVRFLHDLNVERENHHVLWLKYSYPLRRLFLEVQRRLVAVDAIAEGDVWFMQAPELIEAVHGLPGTLDSELLERIQNRRRGYEFEARFSGEPQSPATPEDDYY